MCNIRLPSIEQKIVCAIKFHVLFVDVLCRGFILPFVYKSAMPAACIVFVLLQECNKRD